MSSSPDPAAEHTTPASNLTHLHKQQRRNNVHDTPQARGRNTSRYELGRRDRYGDKVTRIYPREVYVNSAPRGLAFALNSADSTSELSHHCLRIVCLPPRPRVRQTTMPPRPRSCRLLVPREPRQRSTPTTGPSPSPSIQSRARQATAALP